MHDVPELEELPTQPSQPSQRQAEAIPTDESVPSSLVPQWPQPKRPARRKPAPLIPLAQISRKATQTATIAPSRLAHDAANTPLPEESVTKAMYTVDASAARKWKNDEDPGPHKGKHAPTLTLSNC